MEKLERYLKLLKLNAVIYDDNIEEDFDFEECRNYLLSDDFIYYLYAKVRTSELTHNIDEKVKDNIRKIIMFLRENITEDRVEKIKVLNEVIVSLNSTTSINSAVFYQEQFLKRNGMLTDKNKKIYDREMFAKESEMLKSIRYSLVMDHDNIIELLESEEDEFVNIRVKEELLNDYFMNTMYMVLQDIDELLDEPLFRQRAIYVLKSIKEVALNRSKIYEKDERDELDLESYLRAHTLLKYIKRNTKKR